MKIRKIAERLLDEVQLTEDPECGLAKDIKAICEYVLNSTEANHEALPLQRDGGEERTL